MDQRPDGYYWVRLNCSEWEPAYYAGKGFLIESVLYQNDSISEIGPPCSRDDSEQLRLAREVLRDIQKQSCKSGSIRSYVVNSIIDISGVRL